LTVDHTQGFISGVENFYKEDVMLSLICFDADQSKMKSRRPKEEQMILGKTVVDILKLTLQQETKWIETLDKADDDIVFAMAHVPLTTTSVLDKYIDQYKDDFILFKDVMEMPVALYVPKQKLDQHLSVFMGAFESFSNWLEILGETYRVEILSDVKGIYSKNDVEEVSKIVQRKINKRWMDEGVTLVNSESVYIDIDAQIGMDTTIYPNSFVKGTSVIGEGCVIGPNARIESSTIHDDAQIVDSTVLESSVGSFTKVGPYAYIRPGSTVGENVKIGDFVEVKNSTVGDGTKISHLAYVGDADLGQEVNIGCGVVFVNYNGKDKNRSTVKDGAFVGCNVNLVSPVVVESSAYIAAGTTVTKNVPSGALAVGRARQENKDGWVERKQLIKKK